MRRTARRWMGGACGLMVAAAMLSTPALAATSTVIQVFPGPSAIKNALQQANPGDTLNIHTGTYAEGVSVDVASVTLQSAGDGPVTVDAGCHGTAINVSADGVTLADLRVLNGNFFGVNADFVSDGHFSGLKIKSSCPLVEYGINLFGTGAMLIEGNIATGFSDAGIYIGGIVDTGTGSLITQGNTLYGNNRGIIVEDSARVSLIVRRNLLHANANDGLFLHNSDGIVITSNTASDNGYAGIELDPNSDGNLVKGNRSRGHPYDLANGGGTGNCFRDNVYTTSFGSIAC